MAADGISPTGGLLRAGGRSEDDDRHHEAASLIKQLAALREQLLVAAEGWRPAARGVQAECVMLNKGPRIVEAISVLDDILRRMERHQRKKRPLLPSLGVSRYVHTLP